MKKLFSILIGLCLTAALVGCGEDETLYGTIMPEYYIVAVVNSQGENLLSEDVEGNVLDEPIEVYFNNKKYDLLNDEDYHPYSGFERVDDEYPDWLGVFLLSQQAIDKYCLAYECDYAPVLYIGDFSASMVGTKECTLCIGSRQYNLKMIIQKIHRYPGVESRFYIDDVEIINDYCGRRCTIVIDD